LDALVAHGGPVFTLTSIAASAAVATVAAALVLFLWRPGARDRLLAEVAAPALVAGLSLLLWRAAGNVAALNDDPIPLVSPNDVLCPVVTYVALGVYGALGQASGQPAWERRRAVLTLVSLAVNVVTI
jgi:hypothetical protein